MGDVTRMPTHCSGCQKELSPEDPLYMWMAQPEDDVAGAWHKRCFTFPNIVRELARRGVDVDTLSISRLPLEPEGDDA